MLTWYTRLHTLFQKVAKYFDFFLKMFGIEADTTCFKTFVPTTDDTICEKSVYGSVYESTSSLALECGPQSIITMDSRYKEHFVTW